MRRYGSSSQSVVIPGQSAGLQLTLQPTVEAAIPCQAKPTGLFWFSDLTGGFTETSEAAYLLSEDAAGPVLGVAALLGEVCAEPVDWDWEWFPAEGEEGEEGEVGQPGITPDGARLAVYPLADTQPGILLVSAKIAGQSFGPILLSVLRYVCGYGYGYSNGSTIGCGAIDLLTWSMGSTTLTTTPTGENYLAVIKGGWPTETTFEWTVNPAIESGLRVLTDANVLVAAADYNLNLSCGQSVTITITARVLSPDCAPVLLGPIWMIVEGMCS